MIIQGNLGFKNLKGPEILFFIAGILLLLGLFTIELTSEQGLALHWKCLHDNCVTQFPFFDFEVTFSKWHFSDDDLLKCSAILPFQLRLVFT
jgi:hypothetical protein